MLVLPESPRWLCSKGRYVRLRLSLLLAHAVAHSSSADQGGGSPKDPGVLPRQWRSVRPALLRPLRGRLTRSLTLPHIRTDSTDPLVEYEFEEIRAAIKFDREVAANVGWLSLVRTPGNRRRLRIMIAIAFFSQWSGNNLM